MVASNSSGHESAAIDTVWVALTACDTFTFDHYELCWDKGTTTAPSSRGTADVCVAVPGAITTTSFMAWLHRSNKAYGFRIWACDDSTCSDEYGMGTGESVSGTGNAATSTTAAERWVLEDVASYSDTDRAVADTLASAASALFYPASFTTDSGYLGMWYSTQTTIGGSNYETIRHKKASNSGWRNFNTTAWGSITSVAREPQPNGSGAWQECSHPWVAATDQGGTQSIRMFVRCGDTAASTAHYVIYRIDSTNEAGTDFDMTCNPFPVADCSEDGDTCVYGGLCDWAGHGASGAVLEMCSTYNDADCFYLDNAAHGGMAWDYGANGGIDWASETPQMLFSGNVNWGTCSSGHGLEDPDDLYQAAWDTVAGKWQVQTTSSPDCPVPLVADRHDPSTIPLPGGEYKAYALEGHDQFYVNYWNGSAWEDEEEIELAFDDGTTLGSIPTSPTLHECRGNFGAFVRQGGGNADEGAFIKALNETLGHTTCFGSATGLIFAEHRN
jgi:hypothetical protein